VLIDSYLLQHWRPLIRRGRCEGTHLAAKGLRCGCGNQSQGGYNNPNWERQVHQIYCFLAKVAGVLEF